VYYHQKKVVRTSSGEAFIRRGESKVNLAESEIRELEIGKGQVEFEQEPTDFMYPQDFDIELIRQYTNNYRINRELREDLPDDEILVLRQLGTLSSKRFIPNIACALLFAKNPSGRFPGCKIRFLRFEGEYEGTGERWNAIKDTIIDEGPIPRQIAEAERIIDAQIRTFTRFGSDNKFHTSTEYPKVAWYEALVNACVHRSYNLKNMNIFVRMFDDRLEIESPGAFPPLVTPENIYNMHHPRNPFLMDAMFYLKFVRAAREGTRRMRDSMLAMELPLPEFSQREIGYALVNVRLRNAIKYRKVFIDSDAIAIVGAVLFNSLSPEERRAINFVAERGTIGVSDLQRVIQKSWPACKKILIGLVHKGVLEHRTRQDGKHDPQARFVLQSSKQKSYS
jgi:ATP-dependent DNA helicase RecG